jgi:hypothetical protein
MAQGSAFDVVSAICVSLRKIRFEICELLPALARKMCLHASWSDEVEIEQMLEIKAERQSHI